VKVPIQGAALLAVLATLNAGVALIPVRLALFEFATNMPAQPDLLQVYTPLKHKKSAIGGVNLLLALVAMYFATVKPALRRRGA
jgi:catechol-2,3-dioxygenase